MVTDQNHSSDASSEQEVIRYMKKLAQIFGLNEQNAEVYTALSSENRALVKRLDDYHSQHKKLKKKVKRLEKYVDEHLNWLRDDISELYDMKHCNCSSSSESSSSESSASDTIKHKGVQEKIRKKNVYSRNKIN
jgi:phage host-nuclease inhibitor protein Gam